MNIQYVWKGPQSTISICWYLKKWHRQNNTNGDVMEPRSNVDCSLTILVRDNSTHNSDYIRQR